MSIKLPVLDPLAAFVEVGSEHMHVSVGGDDPKVFGTVTSQLHALRDWLLEQHVPSVAMEATGVYWLPLYGVLEAAHLEVRMVNVTQLPALTHYGVLQLVGEVGTDLTMGPNSVPRETARSRTAMPSSASPTESAPPASGIASASRSP